MRQDERNHSRKDAMRLSIQEEIHFEIDVRCLVCLTRLATCSESLAIHMITQFLSSERYHGWKTEVLSRWAKRRLRY